MRARRGAITGSCSDDSESRHPTSTIFGLSHYNLFQWFGVGLTNAFCGTLWETAVLVLYLLACTLASGSTLRLRGLLEFLNRRLNEEFQRSFEAGIPSSAINPSCKIYHIRTPSNRTISEGFRSALSHRISSVPSSTQFSLQVQHLLDCRALQEGCLMLEVL